jgi:hypothetical protein
VTCSALILPFFFFFAFFADEQQLPPRDRDDPSRQSVRASPQVKKNESAGLALVVVLIRLHKGCGEFVQELCQSEFAESSSSCGGSQASRQGLQERFGFVFTV